MGNVLMRALRMRFRDTGYLRVGHDVLLSACARRDRHLSCDVFVNSRTKKKAFSGQDESVMFKYTIS